MASNILIISQGSAFMTNAPVGSLQKAGFTSSVVAPEIRLIGEKRKTTDIYILYAGEFVFGAPDILVYLKDVCAEEEKPLCVIGCEKELS